MIAPLALAILVAVCFLTCVVGVVTGSNSLIVVPAMFQLGIEPREAIATNMFGLTFMSIGASIPFLRQGRIDRRKVTPFIAITLVASVVGALLVSVFSAEGLKLIVSASMVLVALFIILRRGTGVIGRRGGAFPLVLTFVLTFVLGVYGGLFSGGYVTILTAVFVGIYGMTYGEAVASTKVINVFSSAVATAVFMWQGLVIYWLGIIMAVAMFGGAYAGAHWATRLDDRWLRRIFVTTVILLAVKTIIDLAVG